MGPSAASPYRKPVVSLDCIVDLRGATMSDFNADIFKRRRAEFMKRMQPGVAIFPAAPEARRNNDVYFE